MTMHICQTNSPVYKSEFYFPTFLFTNIVLFGRIKCRQAVLLLLVQSRNRLLPLFLDFTVTINLFDAHGNNGTETPWRPKQRLYKWKEHKTAILHRKWQHVTIAKWRGFWTRAARAAPNCLLLTKVPWRGWQLQAASACCLRALDRPLVRERKKYVLT